MELQKNKEFKKKIFYSNKGFVQDMRTLKALERRGLIVFHSQTGSKITGLYSHDKFTCYYIDGIGPNAESSYDFVYNNRRFKIEYVSGCFCPYVKEIEKYSVIYNVETGEIIEKTLILPEHE
jgi:hypothetical protein